METVKFVCNIEKTHLTAHHLGTSVRRAPQYPVCVGGAGSLAEHPVFVGGADSLIPVGASGLGTRPLSGCGPLHVGRSNMEVNNEYKSLEKFKLAATQRRDGVWSTAGEGAGDQGRP